MQRIRGATPAEIEVASRLCSQSRCEMVALSTRGVRRTVEGSDHRIQMDVPQAVIDAVDEVVDVARGR